MLYYLYLKTDLVNIMVFFFFNYHFFPKEIICISSKANNIIFTQAIREYFPLTIIHNSQFTIL